MSEEIVINGILDFDASKSIGRVKQQMEQELSKVDIENVVSFDVLTKGSNGFNRRLEDQLKALREIEKSSAKAANFSISRALFTGTFEGIGRTFSDKVKQDLTNLQGLLSKEVPRIIGSSGLDNKLEDLGVKLFAITANFADNFSGLDSFKRLSTDTLPQVIKAFGEFSAGVKKISADDIIGGLQKTLVTAGQAYVKDLGLDKPVDQFIRQRTQRFQREALEGVYTRAAEIIKESIGKEGTKGLSALEVMPDMDAALQTLGGANAPEAIDQATKELVIAIGGYADATDSFKIAANIAKEEILVGTKEIAAIGVRSQDIAGKGTVQGLLNPIVSGYSKDEVEMAAQAVAALSLKPDLKVKIFGESGGGFIAERATNLLNLTEFGSRVQGTGVATPDLPGNIPAENFTKIMATNLEEAIGNQIILPLSKMGFARLPIEGRQVQGATMHGFEGYANLPELRERLTGAPLPKFDNEALMSEMATVESLIKDLYDMPLEATTETIKGIKQQLKNMQRFATDETVLQDVINYQNDVQKLLESPLAVLQSGYQQTIERLIKVQDMTIAEDANLSDEIAATKSQLSRIIISLLKSISDSTSVQFKEMASDMIKEIQMTMAGDLFNLDIDPVIRRIQLLNEDLAISSEQAIQAGDLTAMKDNRARLEALIKELKVQESQRGEQPISAYKTLLEDLRIQLSLNIDETIKNSTIGIMESIMQPGQSAKKLSEKIQVKLKNTLTELYNKEAIRGRRLDTQDIFAQIKNLDEVTAEKIKGLIVNRIIRDSRQVGAAIKEKTIGAIQSTDIGKNLLSLTQPGNFASASGNVVIGAVGGFSSAIRAFSKELVASEQALFEAVPLLGLLKKGIQNVAVPVAAFTVASQLPGVGDMVGNIPDMVSTFANPFTQYGAESLTQSLPGWIQAPATSLTSNLLSGSTENIAKIATGQLALGLPLGAAKLAQAGLFNALPNRLQNAISPDTKAPNIEQVIKETVQSTIQQINGIEQIAVASQQGINQLKQSIDNTPELSSATGLVQEFANKAKKISITKTNRVITPGLLTSQAKDISIGFSGLSQSFKGANAAGDKESAAKIGLNMAARATAQLKELDVLLSVANQSAESDKKFNVAIKKIEEYRTSVNRVISATNQTFARQVKTSTSQSLRQDIFNEYRESGDNAIAGFILGLDIKKTNKKAIQLGDSFIKELKKSLEIASPSKRTEREIGEPVNQGLFKSVIPGFKAIGQKASNAFFGGLENIGKKLSNGYIKNKLNQAAQSFGAKRAASPSIDAEEITTLIKEQASNLSSVAKEAARSIQSGFKEGLGNGLKQEIENAAESLEVLKAEIGLIEAASRELNQPLDDKEITRLNKEIEKTIKQRDANIKKLGNLENADIKLPQPLLKFKEQVNNFLINPLENAKQAFLKFATIGGSALFGLLLFQVFDLQNAIFGLRESFRLFSEFEVVSRAIINTASSAVVGEKALARLKVEADALKISFLTAAKGVAQLQAATQNTEAAAIVPEITSGLLQASRAYNLTSEQLDRANTAISQALSKGVVSQEELRGQLSEALPNAIQVAARAYGTTVKELNKMIEAGELSSVFFAKFSKQLKAETAIGAAQSLNTLSASLGNLNNRWQALQVALVQRLSPAIKIIVDAATSLFDIFAKNIGIVTALTQSLAMLAVVALAPVTTWILKLSKQIITFLVPAFIQVSKTTNAFWISLGSGAKKALQSAGASIQDFVKTSREAMSNLASPQAVNDFSLKDTFTKVKTGAISAGQGIKAFAGIGIKAIGSFLGSIAGIAASLGAIWLVSEVIAQSVATFYAWSDAGKSATESIKTLNDAMKETAPATINVTESVAENIAQFKDSLPTLAKVANFFVKIMTLSKDTDAFLDSIVNKAAGEQFKLVGVIGNEIEKARQLLRAANTENIDSKQIEKTIELLIMGQDALNKEKILNVEVDKSKQKQLAAIEELIPKLKQANDLASGISTTFGQINAERTAQLAESAKFEADKLAEIAVVESKGLQTKEQIEKTKLQLTESRVSKELNTQLRAAEEISKLLKALPDNDKLKQEQLKTEQEITKLTKEQAESRLALRQNELEASVKALDKYIKNVEASTDAATKKEALLNQLKFNQGLITIDELARREQAAEMKLLDIKKDSIKQQIEVTRASGITQEEIDTRVSDLKIKLSDLELEKAKKVGEVIKKRLEDEKVLRNEAFEQEKARLQQIVELEDARNAVIKARENLKTSRDELLVARLERARDIVKQLNEDENITAEERINLRKELTALGMTGAISVLGLTQEIANLEYEIIDRKEKAQLAENERALKRLETEAKIAAIAGKQAVITAKEKVISTKQELATAAPEQQPLVSEKLKLAEEGLILAEQSQVEINKLKQEELRLQQQQTLEQQRQNDLFKKLDLQRNIEQAKTPEGRRIQVPLAPPQEPNWDWMSQMVEQLKQITENTKQPTQNGGAVFNITAPPGYDGKDLGREFAKTYRDLHKEIYK